MRSALISPDIPHPQKYNAVENQIINLFWISTEAACVPACANRALPSQIDFRFIMIFL